MSEPLRLLLVEDSEDDAELICLELERAGYRVQSRRVETAEAFTEALEESWDLIISDFRMPRFDGLRAFELYKGSGLDVPFIFVSGALGEERAVEAMRAGARDYLLKGSLARLGVAVKRELDEAENRRAQRLAEAARRQEQRRLAMAVEVSGAGIFEYHVPPGPDTHYSARWAQILGLERNDLPAPDETTEWFMDRVHPEDLPMFRARHRDFLNGSQVPLAVELRVRHERGHWVDVGMHAKAFRRSPEGLATHVVGVLMDLSERKQLEAQLRQAQKMEAVGRLAGGVAHDFNNLLTVIFSFGSFVRDKIGDHPARSDLDEMVGAARRAEALTAQLLAFSRQKPVEPRIIDVGDLLQNMDRMLRRLVGEDIDVATRLAEDLCKVKIDPGSLEQVLVNLAVNARDALPDGGKLTIETHNAEVDAGYGSARNIKVPPGQYAVITVSDDGEGMDQATQERIFEPFFTTKDAGRGTGLGLATCYGIIKQAGGFIWVYSELGHGSSFRIYLPRAEGAVQRAALPTSSADLRGSETVLVVEDDEPVRRIAVRALTRLGYRVLSAENGVRALEVFLAESAAIDLVLTDVVMPEMGGPALAEKLLAERPDLKILYMSGYTSTAITHRGVLKPGTILLQKPFTPDRLARKVRDALDG